MIENYRVFSGKQEIELYSEYDQDRSQNLVLIGGLNGAGKTSLLNAFHLLLYGGSLLPEQEYKRILSSALNNNHFLHGGRGCLLELHVLDDKDSFIIRLKLFFNNNQDYTHGERSLISRGRILQLTDTEFKKFIEKKIPSEVAPFFIFDGEKIQLLVEKQENGELKKAIQNIISLDFYKSTLDHLKSAHEIIKERTRKFVSQATVDMTKSELENFNVEKNDLLGRLNKYLEQINTFENERESIREIMNQKLSVNAGSKNELTSKLVNLTKELETNLSKINDYKNQIPNYLALPLINALKTKISIEQKNSNLKNKSKMDFEQFEEFIHELFNKLNDVMVDDDFKQKLYNESKSIWAKIHTLQIETETSDIKVLHIENLSPVDLVNILKYNNDINTRITKLLDEKYSLQEKIKSHEIQLKGAPNALDVSNEEREIDRISTEIGMFIVKKRSVEVKIKKVEEDITRLNRKFKEQIENASKSTEVESILLFSGNAVKLMSTFIERVTILKAIQISNEFTYIIKSIFRKEMDFERIEFDSNQFIIKIYNESGRQIRLADRSAGEKQLIALALIWALTKCANISLPFVIDTPLGRLDSVHRENLAKYYFPELSKQVIILSTDTEVNDKYLDPLKDHVFRKYRLEYDEINKNTEIKEGYFV